MGILDKIKDIFLGGPDSWDERLRPTIQFISPEGREFEGKWRGSPRTMDKKMGIFFYPKVKGNVVQDLSVNSARYAITFWFEGQNNDKEAMAFFQASKEDGQWTVTHPVYGFLGLTLLSVTETSEPVENGNITRMDTDWIEDVDEETLLSAREMAGIIDGLSDDLNISAAQEFANKIKETTETLKNSIDVAVNGVQNLTDFVLDPLKTSTDAINSAFDSIQDGINDTLNIVPLEIIALAGQIQNLIQLPLLGANSLASRLNSYGDLSVGLFDFLPGGTNSTTSTTASALEERNSTAVHELALTATIVAYGQISATSANASAAGQRVGLETRVQAIDAAEQLANSFNLIVYALEEIQTDFADEPIDQQYFSQTQSYTDAVTLINTAIRLLLATAFDLKIEKRFVINKYRAPIEITISEYGDLGDNDSNLDLFIESNGLKSQDILLLPPGREVVVYV
jgi:prophage DNA circulation protein